LLLAISDDVRVLLVKLADRLHNMRTLDLCRRTSARIAEETMEIYAPLAGRMGMQAMREELEELAFKNINRRPTDTVTGKACRTRRATADLSTPSSRNLLGAVRASRANARSTGAAEETLFGVPQDAIEIAVLRAAFRCFRVPHHRRHGGRLLSGAWRRAYASWSVVPGRFKDYISTPKQNDYRSIHTTIVGPSRQRVELQIRTREMQDVAEYGVAAHALYKDVSRGKAIGHASFFPRIRAPIRGCARPSRRCRSGTIRRSSSKTPSWSCSRIRCSVSRPRGS
jgi:guanosine-3',5'-bis(diphosphate) 3'-pyrophosphohydrolase